MKLEEWGSVIVSWATFLDPNEKITSVEELAKSELFNRLLKLLGHSSYHDAAGDNKELYYFLQDQYPALDLGDLSSECKEDTIVRATAFLINCSLHREENDVKKKMTDLPGWTQLCITDFLKELVDVSRKSITRELMFSEISKITAASLPESGKKSPMFSTPLTYTTSPSTGEDSQKSTSSKKPSKIQKLRNEIEMLNILKTELSEELEFTKETVSKLESTLEKKDHEISKLKSELMNVDCNNQCVEKVANTSENIKIDKLKLVIEGLEQEKAKLNTSLECMIEEKQHTYDELQKVKSSLKKMEMEKEVYDNDRTALESQITQLKNAIEELRAANKEQSDIISELQARDDSKTFSDSQNDSLLLPESLGQHVIDVVLQDKEDEIKNHLEQIENLKSKIEDLKNKEKNFLNEIESKTSTIKNNEEDLRNLECQNIFLSNSIREKDSIVVSMQSSLDMLNEEVASLKNKENSLTRELQSINSYNQQLLKEIDGLTVVINNNSSEKEMLLKSLNEKETALQQCFVNLEEVQIEFNSQLKVLHTELEAKTEECRQLDTERMQLATTVEYYRGQVNFLESKLKGREDEILENINIIGKLESDIESLKSSENKMKSQINTLESNLKEVNSDLNLKTSFIAEIENKLSSLTNEKENHISEKESLKTKLNQKVELIKNLEVNLNAKENRLKIVEEQNAVEQLMLKKEISQKLSDIENLKATLNDKDKYIQMQEDLHSQEQVKIKNEISQKLEHIRSLEVRLNDKEMYILMQEEHHAKEQLEMKNEISQKSKLIETFEGNLTEKEKDLEIIQEQYEAEQLKLKNAISEKSELIESLEVSLNDKEKCMQKLKELHAKEQHELNDEILQKSKLIESFEASLTEKDKDLKIIREEYEAGQLKLKNTISKKSEIIESLEVSLNDKEKDIQKLKEQHAKEQHELNNEILQKSKLIETFEANLREKEKYLKIIQEQYEAEQFKLKNAISEKSELITSLEDSLNDKEKNVQMLQEQYTKEQIEKQKFQSVISEKSELIEALEANLKGKENNLKEIEEQLEKLNSDSSEKDHHIQKLVEQHKKETLKLQSEISQKVDLINSLEVDLNNKVSCIKILEEQITAIECKLNDKENHIKLLVEEQANEVLKLNSTIDDLKSSINELNFIKNELDSENGSLQQEKTRLITSYCEQLESLRSDKELMASRIEKINCDVILKDNIISDLRHEIGQYVNDMKKLNEEKTKISVQLDSYREKYEAEIEKSNNLLHKLSQNKEKISELLLETKEKDNSFSEIRTALMEAEEEKLLYENKCQEMETNLLSLNESIAKLDKKVVIYEENLKEKDNTINALKKSICELNENISQQDNIIDSYKRDVDLLKTENTKLTTSLSEREKELIEQSRVLNSSESNSLNRICELNKEMVLVKSLKDSVESENIDLKKEIKDLLGEKENIVSKLSAIETEHSSCKEKVLSSESLIIELKDKESILKEELCKSNERESKLLLSVETNKAIITKLQEEISQKEVCIENLERSVKDALKSRDAEVSELNSMLNSFKQEVELEKIRIKENIKTIDEKNKEIESHLSHIKSLENDLLIEKKSLNNHLESCKSLINRLNSELKSNLEKLRTLEMEHSNCHNKIHNIESVIHELRDKESILKEELMKSKEREESFKNELQSQMSIISNQKEEINSLQKTLSDREFDEGILFTKFQAKEAEVNKIKLELGDIMKQKEISEEKYQEEIDLHIKKIQDLDNTIGKLNNQFIKVNREKENLILELDEKNKIIQDWKIKQNQFEFLKKEKEDLQNKYVVKSQENIELENKLANAQEELQIAKTNGQLLQAKLESNAFNIQKLNEEVVVLTEKSKEEEISRTDLINQISLKNKLIADLESKISSTNRGRSVEIESLKEAISNKDELIEKLSKEKNILMLDMDLRSQKEDFLNSQLEAKNKEIDEVRSKFIQAEGETSKLKLACSEQDETIRSLYATLHSQNSEIKEKDTEIIQLQREIKTLQQNLLSEKENKNSQGNTLAKAGKEEFREGGLLFTEKDLENKIQEVKAAYEKKVETYKATVKKRFAEKLEDLTYSLQNENTDLKERYMKEQERCAKLQSELWNSSDKLLIAQEQNRTLLTKLQARNTFEVLRPTEPLSPLSKARSMEVLSGRNRGIDNFARDISLNESSCSSRRSSIRSLPRGMGKVFPAAEEDGEVFDNRYLADLKAGICNVPVEEDRMSTLQYRNSLCPPHLKSSYPAETQFLNSVKEDDIKSGSTHLSSSNSDSDVRKTKIQSSYKKPGPPTPSKNGGHLSFQGNEKVCPPTPRSSRNTASVKEGVVNESFVLKEINNVKPELPPPPRPHKPATPSRIKALFSSKKDENSPKRKSMFLRRN